MTFAQKLAEAGRRAEARRAKQGDHVEQVVQAAIDAMNRRRSEEEVERVEMRKRLDVLERGGARVTKADDAATKLRALAEKDLDRRPLGRGGEPRSLEQALDAVARSREGSRLMKELRAQDRADANSAFRKAFDMDDAPAESGPSPTRGEQGLEELAKARAKSDGVTKEQALRRVLDTPEGRELHRAHRAEVAAR
jgi:hypothetical protein